MVCTLTPRAAAILESRYLYDNGHPGQVLTVDPLYNRAPVYCFNEENPGSAYWQTFSAEPILLRAKALMKPDA